MQDEPGVRAVTEMPAAEPRDPGDAPEPDGPREGPADRGGPGLSLDTLRSGGGRVLEFESNSVLVATILLAVAIGILHPEFFAWGQIKDVLSQSVYVGILAAGHGVPDLDARDRPVRRLDVRPHADRAPPCSCAAG